jgi:hypothetical protein
MIRVIRSSAWGFVEPLPECRWIVFDVQIRGLFPWPACSPMQQINGSNLYLMLPRFRDEDRSFQVHISGALEEFLVYVLSNESRLRIVI